MEEGTCIDYHEELDAWDLNGYPLTCHTFIVGWVLHYRHANCGRWLDDGTTCEEGRDVRGAN